MQLMKAIQFSFPPHNDGFKVFVLVSRWSKMRHAPEGLTSKFAIKSLNWWKRSTS